MMPEGTTENIESSLVKINQMLLIRKIFKIILFGLGLIFLGSQLSDLIGSGILHQDDFVEYWAAGRLNLSGENPYDPESLFKLQKEVWPDREEPLMMWNPPWTLALVMPFGYLSYNLARVLWIAGNFILVFLSINGIWHVYSGASRIRWIGWLVGLTFMPTVIALRIGQISPLLLAGLAGFLLAIRDKRYYLAGMACSLLLFKPHLLSIFWLALAAWMIHQRQYRIAIGCAIPLVFGSLLALTMNPNVFQDYALSANNQPPTVWVTATIGAIIRLCFGANQIWYQFVPFALGVAWFGWYWANNYQTWSWRYHMPLIVLASMVSAPFGWSFDQIVLLLAILPITIWLIRDSNQMVITIFTAVYFLIQGLIFAINLLGLNYIWLVWVPPTFTMLYLILLSKHGQNQISSRQQA